MIGSSSKNHCNPITGHSPLSVIPGISTKLSAKLSILGLHCLTDCLWHFPHTYDDRSRVTPIESLLSGQRALIYGKIIDIQSTFYPKPRLKIFVQDASDICVLHFFHYTKQYLARFRIGDWWRFFGNPSIKKNVWQMALMNNHARPAARGSIEFQFPTRRIRWNVDRVVGDFARRESGMRRTAVETHGAHRNRKARADAAARQCVARVERVVPMINADAVSAVGQRIAPTQREDLAAHVGVVQFMESCPISGCGQLAAGRPIFQVRIQVGCVEVRQFIATHAQSDVARHVS